MTSRRGTSALGFCLFCRRIAQLALAFTQRIRDAGQHAFEIPQNVIIPESDDFESVGLQPRGSRGVLLCLFGMLAAIDLDDQLMPQAAEIDDVIADRMLTAKLRAIEALRAKVLPEEAFGLGLFATETADIFRQLFWCAHNEELYLKI